jgi:putative flippase GtrA
MNDISATRETGGFLRWLKFNAVGAIGIGVQLSTLSILTSGLHVGYLVATALSVEAAIVHNFLWHERFTWADRLRISPGESLRRFAKFNLTTGLFSIGGNLIAMRFLVGTAHLHYLVANMLTIAICSILNFLVSDRLVFSNGRSGFSPDSGGRRAPLA